MTPAGSPRSPQAKTPPLHLPLLSASEAQLEPCEEVRQWLDTDPSADAPAAGPGVVLAAGSRPLSCAELQAIAALLGEHGMTLLWVEAHRPETRVAAAALGLDGPLTAMAAAPTGTQPSGSGSGDGSPAAASLPTLQIRSGPIRAGEHLQVEGSVLLLGDVNPGGRISAEGHVLVWGKLRGVAHAGSRGDRGARITALHLRPLQLRIADVVARGPQDVPPAGLAEEARLDGNGIVIDPAPGSWPLARIPTVGLNLA